VGGASTSLPHQPMKRPCRSATSLCETLANSTQSNILLCEGPDSALLLPEKLFSASDNFSISVLFNTTFIHQEQRVSRLTRPNNLDVRIDRDESCFLIRAAGHPTIEKAHRMNKWVISYGSNDNEGSSSRRDKYLPGTDVITSQ
jgi:hypothetical protein